MRHLNWNLTRVKYGNGVLRLCPLEKLELIVAGARDDALVLKVPDQRLESLAVVVDDKLIQALRKVLLILLNPHFKGGIICSFSLRDLARLPRIVDNPFLGIGVILVGFLSVDQCIIIEGNGRGFFR